ncbi:MAG: bifunctional demethylmenaquinone methyltransferase/2-methoxy-6-polyprenyl-1,4-benzoquinol methylase UbiE [Gammaproteobacteria bacterium]|nr:bifunctional demethylmenaquinone methyltransferase/2-methoxy-6-polyprenyl-1,4-benzoquinol methylase UbiE [Gammaproteobacteria bacterium]
MDQDKKTHFGFESVKQTEKQAKVNAVFSKVASRYDLMNDVMSLGVHHFWKWLSIYTANIKPHTKILDLAAGSGDLSRLICKQHYPYLDLTLADINANMLMQGRMRMLNEGFFENIHYSQVNAEALPFADQIFDVSFMAFGLRNVTNQANALKELCRITKPGGKLCILEFSKPKHALLSTFYDWYSFHVIPKMGQLFANDSASYQYLVESIRMHPDQEKLKQMILDAGFDQCEVTNLSGGIVALHVAYRY